jgi:hypothetical protein
MSLAQNKIKQSKKRTTNDFKELQSRAHKLFDILRKVLKNEQSLLNQINVNFETAYLEFLKYIPDEYHLKIIRMFDSVGMLLACVDYNKLSNSLKIILTFNLNFGLQEFDFEKYLYNLIETKSGNDAGKKNLLKTLLSNSKPIINCIKFMIQNPGIISENLKVFGEVEDIF